MGGIDAAAQALGHAEREVGQPAAVVDVVVVEMDGAILLRRQSPVHLCAVPVPALHGAGRQVDDLAVVPAGREIADARGRRVLREVPDRGDVREAERLGRIADTAGGGRGIDGAGEQPHGVDLAVVVAVQDRPSAGHELGDPGGHGERRIALVDGGGRNDGALLAVGIESRIGRERLLPDARLLSLGIETGADAIPFARQQRPPDGDRDRLAPVAEQERDAAGLVDDQGPALFAGRQPMGDQALPALCRRGRPDHGGDGEALEPIEHGGAGHHDGRAGMHGLQPPAVVPAHRRLQDFGLEARSGRIGVAVDEPHDIGAIGRNAVAAHHEADRLARHGTEAIRIAKDLHVRTSPLRWPPAGIKSERPGNCKRGRLLDPGQGMASTKAAAFL